MNERMSQNLLNPQATANSPEKWTQVSIKLPIEKVGQALTPLLNITRAWLETIVTLLKLIKNFLISIPDPQAAAIYAACEALKAAVDTLLKTNPVHILIVPPTFVDPEEYNALLASDSEIPPLVSGGNARFLGQVFAALDDTNDIYRPQFANDASVAGIVLFAGAETYTDLLPLLNSLKKLLSGQNWNWTTEISNTGISIQNMKYDIIIGSAESNVGKLAIRLTWQPISTVAYIDGQEVARVKSLILERSELGKSEKKTFAIELPTMNSFLDITAEPGTTYLYELKAFASDNVLLASNQIVVITPPIEECRFHSNLGDPPNWYAAPGLLYFFPEVIKFLYRIRNWAEAIENSIEDPLKKYKKYIENTANNIEAYIKNIKEILTKLQEIAELLSLPETFYLGMYFFTTTQGNAGIKNCLTTAFGNLDDPNRPPFDSSDALTTGIVVVTGGTAEIAQLQNALAMLTESKTGTAMKTLAAQINKELEQRIAENKAEINILENLLAEE